MVPFVWLKLVAALRGFRVVAAFRGAAENERLAREAPPQRSLHGLTTADMNEHARDA